MKNCKICSSENSCQTCKRGFEFKDGKCQEICGDKVHIEDECDDGNTGENDGCSEECKV